MGTDGTTSATRFTVGNAAKVASAAAFLVGTAIVTQSYFDTDIEGGLSVVKQGHLLNVPLYTVGNLALTTATARMSFRAGVAQKMKAWSFLVVGVLW